jgi:hypothetical protein
MMIPNEIMSRRTVMKMKMNAARDVLITRGILAKCAGTPGVASEVR